MSKLSELLALFDDEQWLLRYVDDVLLNRPQRPPTSGWWHPSAFGNRCDAFLAFDYAGAERKPIADPVVVRVLDHGHNRDQSWKQYLRDAGLSIVTDTQYQCECGKIVDDRHCCLPTLRIRGECDDIVRHPISKQTYIVEIKTIKSARWAKLQKPLDEHIVQVHPYMFAKNINQTLFIYENSDTKQVKIFKTYFDIAIWNALLKRLERIQQAVAADIEPQRTPTLYETSCPFYHLCATTRITELWKNNDL